MILKEVNNFLKEFLQSTDYKIEEINNSASIRKYFRITKDSKSYILMYSGNIEENKSFLYFDELFYKAGVNVPKVFKVNDKKNIYIQEDLGNISLMELLLEKGETEEIEELYKKSIDELVKIHLQKDIDYSNCYDYKSFNKMMILDDLMYFKFCFLKVSNIPFKQQQLTEDFEKISDEIENLGPKGFVYRDFQSRNIMISERNTYIIDFQGGIEGPIVYDIVSLLWQAKANLSFEFKDKMKKYYFEKIREKIDISEKNLEKAYHYCMLSRFFQVLGVYGFRGLVERKSHFIESIQYGISNLGVLLKIGILEDYPELKRIVESLLLQQAELKSKLN